MAGGTAVSAIVVTLARGPLVNACLRSLDAALDRVAGGTELIVVVNAPGSIALETERRHLVIEPGRNVGFAGGVQAGLGVARGEWIALVNDDCIVEPDALAALLEAGSADARIGSVAAQIRFPGGATLNSAGLEVDELGIAHERLVGRSVTAATDAVDVFGASAAAALYRRAMLDEVGGFDESFFAYLEDADLAWRARMAGWRAVYAPRAVATHHHSATLGHRSPEKHFLVGRNRVRMLAKNATREQLVRIGHRMLAYDLAYVAFATARSRTLAPLRGRLAGLREWRAYRAAGRPHRRQIQLAPAAGRRAALARDRAYRRG